MLKCVTAKKVSQPKNGKRETKILRTGANVLLLRTGANFFWKNPEWFEYFVWWGYVSVEENKQRIPSVSKF